MAPLRRRNRLDPRVLTAVSGGVGRLPDEVLDRLAGHVATVVANARIPAADREDVAEELRGHLVEMVGAAIADGRSPDGAADQAIATFGSSDLLGREFMATYRGRLWASTIGQLLPTVGVTGVPPRVVVWMVRFDRLTALGSLIVALVFLGTGSPVRAVVGAALGVGAAAILWLAAKGLSRGQGWALAASSFVCSVNALAFFVALGQPAGKVTFSINGLIGLILLIRLGANLAATDEWTRHASPIPRRLGWPVGIVLLGWSAVVAVDGNLPDPTQIGPGDIRASALVSCAPPPPGTTDPAWRSLPVPTLNLRVIYDRVDARPRGILREPASWGDFIEFDAGPLYYTELGEVRAIGTTASGASRPVDLSSWTDMPARLFSIDAQRPVVGEILGSEQEPGRTIELTAPTSAVLDDDGVPRSEGVGLEGIVGTVRLYHLDRFTLQGFAECDRPVTLEPLD